MKIEREFREGENNRAGERMVYAAWAGGRTGRWWRQGERNEREIRRERERMI